MLETIREFALEQLAASPDAEAVRNRHALRFLALAEEAGPHLLRVERRAWLARLEREHDNLRAAFDFCAGSGRIVEALRLAAALWRFWQFRGHLREGLQRVRRVLDDPASRAHPAAREAALEAAGGLAYWLGDMAATTASYDEGAGARARERRPGAHLQRALQPLLPLRLGAGRQEPRRAGRQRRGRDRRGAGPGPAGRRSGRHRPLPVGEGEHHELPAQRLRIAALVPLREAIPIFRELGDHFGLAWALHGEGLPSLKTGDLPAARAAFDEQVTLLGEARDPSGLAIALGNQSQLAIAEGDGLRAIRLAGASAALRHLTGAELVSKVDAIEGRVIEATPENQGAWNEGLAMTFDQALAYALRRP